MGTFVERFHSSFLASPVASPSDLSHNWAVHTGGLKPLYFLSANLQLLGAGVATMAFHATSSLLGASGLLAPRSAISIGPLHPGMDALGDFRVFGFKSNGTTAETTWVRRYLVAPQ
jgi:hypothetical protein